MPRTRALILLALVACDSTDVPPPVRRPTVGCASDAICPVGLACVEGACVGGAAPDFSVHLRIRPSTDGAYGSADLLEEGGVRFDGSPVLRLETLVVQRKEEVLGRVLRSGRAVAARVTAVARGGVPGTPLQLQAIEGAGSSGPNFRFDVPPLWPIRAGMGGRSVTWDVRATPAPELYPPRSFPQTMLTDGMTLELPGGPLQHLEGRVVVSSANPTPLRAVEVRALDADGQVVSTTATTDELGAFRVAVWSDAPQELTLRATSTLAETPLPTVDVTVVRGPEPRIIEVGDVGALFELTGTVSGELEVPAGARVSFRSRAIGNGSFSATVSADDEGGFAVLLYPGEYTVDLVPPAPYRVARLQRTLTADEPELHLVAPSRVRVDGCVQDFAGTPVEGANVSARLTEAGYVDPRLNELPGAVPDRTTTATPTDEAGQFTLNIDGGAHRLEFIAPPERGLPTFSVPLMHIAPDAGSLDLTSAGCFRFPAAAVLTVNLEGADAAPVLGAVVEAWREGEQGSAKLAQATSDEEGHVVLVLPNSE